MKGIRISKASVYLQSFLYLTAGINHFRNPDFYYKLIPPYLPNPPLINIASGIIEIILGVLLLFPATRRLAAFAIIAMLIAFIPAHIYQIQSSDCHANEICWPSLIGWLRLLIGQPLLIWWAWKVRDVR